MTVLKVSTVTDLQVAVHADRQKRGAQRFDLSMAEDLRNQAEAVTEALNGWQDNPPRPQDAFSRSERMYRVAIQAACLALRIAEEARCLIAYHDRRKATAEGPSGAKGGPAMPVGDLGFDAKPGRPAGDPRRRVYGNEPFWTKPYCPRTGQRCKGRISETGECENFEPNTCPK